MLQERVDGVLGLLKCWSLEASSVISFSANDNTGSADGWRGCCGAWVFRCGNWLPVVRQAEDVVRAARGADALTNGHSSSALVYSRATGSLWERDSAMNRYLKFVAQLSASIVLIVFLMYLFGFIGVVLWGLSD